MPENDTNSREPSVIEIFLKEYDHRFQEVLHHLERYDKQADYLNLFLTSIIAGAGILFSDKLRVYLTPTLIFVFLLFGAAFVFYLFSAIVNSLFMIYLNGGRIAGIEREINERTGSNILNWDSVAMPHFFKLKPIGKDLWVRPTVLAGLWIFIIFLLICGILCFLCFQFAPAQARFYIPAMAFLAIFHIYQWALLNSVGLKEVRTFFMSETQEIADFPIKPAHLFYVAPVVSVIIIAAYSMYIGAFTFRSKYNFPFLSIPSIYIGDLIILPLLNYRMVRWFKDFFPPNIFRSRYSVVAAVISLICNFYIHYLWIHDPWFGFMDVTYGRLTLAGWDHAVFSTGEMWAILLFFICWTSCIRTQKWKALQAGKTAWLTFLAFSIFGIADLSIKHFFVLKEGGWNWLLLREATISLVPFTAGMCIYLYLLRQKNKSNTSIIG
jgi:hypothetical protein